MRIGVLALVTATTVGLHFLPGCSRLTSDASSPYFFVNHVDRVEADFDETRFRSFRKDGALTTPITLEGDTRRALAPPLPSRLSFDLEVPPDPVLRFAIGVFSFDESILPSQVEFRVLIDPGAGEQMCFSDFVRRVQPNLWLDHEVDLSRWSGRRVKLTLETVPRLAGQRAASVDDGVIPLWGNPVLASLQARSEKPNVILISIDCLRADHVGAYGYERNTTPRIDQLAEEAVVFETVMGTSSWTHPTHMSMLTGLPPSIHGATRWSKLDQSVQYLPEALAQAGYRADGVVSVDYLSQYFGLERGYHSYRFSFDPGATRVVDDAIDLIRRGLGQNQFLFVHTLDVHWPYSPPREFRTRFGPRSPDISGLLAKVGDNLPPDGRHEVDQVIDLYDGELAYVDQELGRLFDELKSLGLYDRSLIIVTADHGEAFYEHGFWKHTQTLYEEMVRIPLIVKWPDGSLVGRVETQVSQVDIFPTILEEAGLVPPASWAIGLSRYLGGGSPPQSPRTTVSEVTWDSRPDRPAAMKIAFRTDELKYIATLHGLVVEGMSVDDVRQEELYNLVVDPDERKNLLSNGAQAFGGDLRSFREELGAYLAEARQLRSVRRGGRVILDDEVLERLRGLGYVER